MRTRDAEAELNLPPGFRFHPTEQELVIHYLCRRAADEPLPVSIIAELNLYEHDPWQLPDKALFGNREWCFFTPRDREYPKGSRPNRAAGSGYWKATGADKPVASAGCARPLGIKKALVFYAGKSPNGVKTDWIMHEYRLADANRTPNKKGGSNLRLDDWVLCRLYNKKNNWVKAQRLQAEETTTEEAAVDDTCSDSFRTPESDVDNDVHTGLGSHGNHFGVPPPQLPNAEKAPDGASMAAGGAESAGRTKQEDENWLRDLDLDGLGSSPAAFGVAPTMDLSYQEYLVALPSGEA